MELVNAGVKPIILLQREPLFPSGALARKPEDFEGAICLQVMLDGQRMIYLPSGQLCG